MNKQRIHLIDGMRGLSLFGILLANLLIFQYGLWGKDKLELSLLDTGAYHFLKIFVEGSFMPIFTFLFGYSIIKLADSLKRKDLKVKRYFARRSFLLAVMGILHGTFIWEGDILFFYGLMGFFLLFFINRKTKTILVFGALSFLITNVILLIPVDSNEALSLEESFTPSEAYLEKANEVYATGTYSEIYDHRMNEDPLEDVPDSLFLASLVLAPMLIAPLFLIGMYAARVNLFANPERELKGYKIGTWILLPLGIAMKAAGQLLPHSNLTDFYTGSGALLLSIGYICAFSWLYSAHTNAIAMRIFENVGKLSLTNYLMQSVICTTIFYGYGFGLFGKLGVFNSILLGALIFITQSVASYYYLKLLRRGPFEYILRTWTYFSWNGRIKKPRKMQMEESTARETLT